MEIEDYSSDQYFTKYSEVDNTQIIIIFNNQFMLYFIMKLNIFNKLKESSAFSFNNRYLVNIFYNIMPDIGATGVSIIGKL